MLDALLIAIAASFLVQEPTPIRLELWTQPQSWVRAASSDGDWIAGIHPRSDWLFWPFRWNAKTGIEGLGRPLEESYAISDDGEVVLTRIAGVPFGEPPTAAVWTPLGLHALPRGGVFEDSDLTQGTALTRNGRFAAGWGTDSSSVQSPVDRGWVWEIGERAVVLDSPPGTGSRVFDLSDDGRVAVGLVQHKRYSFTLTRPAIWLDGQLRYLTNGWGGAYGTDRNGTYVTGELAGRPFLWSNGRGVSRIEILPTTATSWFDLARGLQVSDDGGTVLFKQYYPTPMGEFLVGHFLWREGAGSVAALEFIELLGAQFPDDVAYKWMVSLGADGRTLVGTATTADLFDKPYLLWRAVLPPAAEVYCTSQTSAGGCTPSIDFTGTPSARTGAGFTVSASDVPAGAQAVLAYGTSGAASVPFGGGVLCVAEPTTRVMLANAGGGEGCEGALAIDFNAVIAQASDPALVGGAHVWTQLWIRDAGAPPPQLLLTDALMFTLWP